MIEPELLLEGLSARCFSHGDAERRDRMVFARAARNSAAGRFSCATRFAKNVAQKCFRNPIDTSFADVMKACAKRADTWINEEIVESYTRLHELGHAHSVEAWRDGKLAGGLYGVSLGGAFFGESMFHRVTDASKIALCGLVDHLREKKFVLLDTQWLTPHLLQFGGVEISRNQYLRLLRRAVDLPSEF